MSLKKIIFVLICAVGLGASATAYAQTRPLYIGDMVTLEINTTLSEEALREKLAAFEIVTLQSKPDGYTVTLRTFTVGEQRVSLGDTEIVFQVQSTLEDIQREEIFEGERRVMGPGFPFLGRVFFYAVAGVFVVSGLVVGGRAFLNRKRPPLPPLPLFLQRAAALSAEDEGLFVDLTHHFKAYLESVYGCTLMGKTSDETLRELEGIPALGAVLSEISMWLTACDRMKFTGVTVSRERKQAHYHTLLTLAEKIDKREGAA